jgi:hypothetical protein
MRRLAFSDLNVRRMPGESTKRFPIGHAYDRPLARSLYAIQLEEWFEALRSIGRDPESSVLIVQEEELKAKPVQIGNKIFEWLGIQPFDIIRRKTTTGDKIQHQVVIQNAQNAGRLLLSLQPATVQTVGKGVARNLGLEWRRRQRYKRRNEQKR